MLKNKKGQLTGGLITGLIMGVVGLVISVIVGFVIVSTITDANLLTSGSAEDNATDRLVANLTAGVENVSGKIPTILLIAAVVLILGVLVFFISAWKRMQLGGGI